MKPATWFCYMLRCKDGSLYVGVTMDPMHRVKQHNWGVGAKFTAQRRPVELIWWEQHPDIRPPVNVKFSLKGGDGKRS